MREQGEPMRRAAVEYLDFFCIDIVAIELSLVAAWYIHSRIASAGPEAFWKLSMVLPVFHWFLLLLIDPYRGVLQRGYLQEMAALLKLQTCSFGLVVFFFYFLNVVSSPRRGLLLIYYLVVIPLTFALRFVHKFHLKRRYNDLNHTRQILVVTTETMARELIGEMTSSVIRNYQFFGLAIIDRNMTGERIDSVLVTADRDSLIEYTKTNVIDEVFIHLPDDTAYNLQLAQQFLEMGVSVHIGMEEAYQRLPNRRIENMFGYDVLTTTISPISVRQPLLKRLMDIGGGFVGCLITILLTLVIGPAIFVSSPGPIFFSQNRVGKNGRIFKLYKFRSMYVDAEERKKDLLEKNRVAGGLMFKMENDPRIIKGIGHFIRKTSLDEFPQFWNVLKGEMSLVGTRPPTEDEYERYSPQHKRRLALRPGITGLWQISGRNSITDFEEIVRLDTEYIKYWSISLDLKIIWKTIFQIWKNDDAF